MSIRSLVRMAEERSNPPRTRTTPEAILKLLVACDPLRQIMLQGGYYQECCLCGGSDYGHPFEHETDCAWLLAFQYLQGLM